MKLGSTQVTSDSEVIQDPDEHLPHKDETSTQEDSDSDFQPLIKSSFNCVLSSNLFEGLEKNSGKRKSLANIKKAAKEKRNKCKEKVLHTSEMPEEE
ncbi:hypothetical protein G6F43_006150 [Rhizopus delemar]|nr:hypothetical protein G6F43_006150 [Rhizopus delemar]